MAKNKNELDLEKHVESLESTIRRQEEKIKSQRSEIKRLRSQINKGSQSLNDPSYQEYLTNEREDKILENEIKKLKDTWKCYECGDGTMVLKLLQFKTNNSLYYRECDSEHCSHRTDTKPLKKFNGKGFPKEMAKKINKIKTK